jgi:Helix-turn-helix of DDE superfamily endonuclease
MTYEQMKHLKRGDFKRACGVSPTTCEHMLQVFRAHEQRKVQPGRPPKLALEDQLLLTLQYWREYRTYFHLRLNLLASLYNLDLKLWG